MPARKGNHQKIDGFWRGAFKAATILFAALSAFALYQGLEGDPLAFGALKAFGSLTALFFVITKAIPKKNRLEW